MMSEKYGGKAVRKERVRNLRNLKVQYKGPRALNLPNFVEARKVEILAMTQAIQNSRYASTSRVFQRLPRHLRRRTASYNALRVPRRLRFKAKLEVGELQLKAKRKNRLFKRTANNRKLEYLRRQTDKTWLETHTWHAKRFHMKTIWGYRLGNRTTFKSFRASYRARKSHTVIHDASYMGIMELVGSSEAIVALLKNYLDPSTVPISSKRFCTGRRVCHTFFFQRGQYPAQLVCPVQLLWSPTSESTDPDARSLWLTVHPASYDQIYKYLTEDQGTPGVTIHDLRKKLNIFQLSGPTVLSTLLKALPVCDATDPTLRSHPASQTAWELLSRARDCSSFPLDSVLALTVYDPRLWIRQPKLHPGNATLSNAHQASLHELLLNWPPTLAQSDLWDSELRSELSTGKITTTGINQRRSQLLVPGSVLPPTPQDARIPILLIRTAVGGHPTDPHPAPSTYSWNLVVPGGWGLEFWKALVFNGAREEGLRDLAERHFELGRPYFPHDFPTTPAYQSHIQEQAAEQQATYLKRPPAKRIPYASYGTTHPFQPPFASLTTTPTTPTTPTDSDNDPNPANEPWSLFGPGTLLQSFLTTTTDADLQSHLTTHFTTLMTKRGLPLLVAPHLTTCLVTVRLVMVGKGSTLTHATVFGIDPTAYPLTTLIDPELIQSTPSPTPLPLGYVTTGHFALTTGHAHALATLSLPRLLNYLRSVNVTSLITSATTSPLVLVHPTHSPTLRLAYLHLLLN